MPELRAAWLALLLAVLAGSACSARPVAGGSAVLELQAGVNTLDGCANCGCRVAGELHPESVQTFWVAFGRVRRSPGSDGQALHAAALCGRGAFALVRKDFHRHSGIPYVLVELAVQRRGGEGGVELLEVEMERRKFTGFEPDGQPLYSRSERGRLYNVAEGDTIMLPLLLADDREQQALGVHEVTGRLRLALPPARPENYFGALVIEADLPGAAVYLDGNLAGRTEHGAPLLLVNVPPGTREVRLRDFSGREAIREVTARAGQTAEMIFPVTGASTALNGAGGLAFMGPNPEGHAEYLRARGAALMVHIPAGEFVMGSREGKGEAHERPQRRVSLSGYLMDKTEVTWGRYLEYVEVTGAPRPRAPLWGMPAGYPASLLTWFEARDYCEWAGARLPTEAEWEKAARGTDGSQYPWGDKWDARRCNAISGGPHRPASAGSFPACVSPYGVLDMTGSMWEWTADYYQPDDYVAAVSVDPRGPESGRSRSIRGGGWMTQPNWLRAAHRFRLPPVSRRPDLGFRCARDGPGQ